MAVPAVPAEKVKAQTFAIAALEMPDLKEAVQANLAGMGRVKFERIKIPSGGGLAFEVLDDNGEPTAVSEMPRFSEFTPQTEKP